MIWTGSKRWVVCLLLRRRYELYSSGSCPDRDIDSFQCSRKVMNSFQWSRKLNSSVSQEVYELVPVICEARKSENFLKMHFSEDK